MENTPIGALIRQIRGILFKLDAETRVAVFDMLMTGYCQHCGKRLPNNDSCNCQRDE